MNESLDETELSEITIQPDGRVYVFGASLPILEILQSLQPNDPRILTILRHAKPAEGLKAVESIGTRSASGGAK